MYRGHRCPQHGGLSTGPITEAGRQRALQALRDWEAAGRPRRTGPKPERPPRPPLVPFEPEPGSAGARVLAWVQAHGHRHEFSAATLARVLGVPEDALTWPLRRLQSAGLVGLRRSGCWAVRWRPPADAK